MAFTAEQLAGNCSFLMSIRFLAGQTRSMFDAGPRLARLLASHQRWLLTQTAYALHLEYDPRDPTSALGMVGALADLKNKTTAGGTLYVFALPPR